MTRPQEIRKIYFELRAEIGEDVSSHELLRLADALQRLREGRELGIGLRVVEQRRTFDELGVDEALSDGGWRVMNREANWVNALYEDDGPLSAFGCQKGPSSRLFEMKLNDPAKYEQEIKSYNFRYCRGWER